MSGKSRQKHFELLKSDDDKWLWVEAVLSRLRDDGYTWDEISLATGRTRPSFSHVKRGKRVPSIKFVEDVAKRLHSYGYEVNTKLWISNPKEQELVSIRDSEEHQRPYYNFFSESGDTLKSRYAVRFRMEVYDRENSTEQWHDKGIISSPSKILDRFVYTAKDESFDVVWAMFKKSVDDDRKKLIQKTLNSNGKKHSI